MERFFLFTMISGYLTPTPLQPVVCTLNVKPVAGEGF
jgi:hypothetical protein